MKKVVYNCSSCGAELIFKGNSKVKECSYCGNVLAILDNSIETFGFKEILPFEFDEKQAFEFLKLYNKVGWNEQTPCEKVYVPFYLCNFDFGYLANCRKEVNTNDGKEIEYYDVYVDGKVKNYFSCAVNINVNFLCHERNIKCDNITKFDPLTAGDYRLIDGKFIYYEKIVENIANDFGRYNATNRNSSSVRILNSECAEYNENVKVVLVPFYSFKLSDGDYYLLGQNVHEGVIDEKMKSKVSAGIGLVFFLLLVLISFIFSSSFIMEYGHYEEALFLILFLCFVFVVTFAPKRVDNDIRAKSCKSKRIDNY